MTNINVNEDIFETFLIKEQELAYVEKNHAQACIRQMAKEYKEYEDNSTIITKVKDFFSDQFEYFKIQKMISKNKRKLSKLSDSEKMNKELEHKVYKHHDFKTHIFLNRKYTERHLIADCGGFHFPIIEYTVYLRVEYIEAEIWTGKHLKKTLNSYEEALQYFLDLDKEYKQKSGKMILDYLTEKIDKHCTELKQRISSFSNI